MALHFIFGASGAGKSYFIYKKIIRESMEYPQTQFLILVPEQFTMQTQKELVRMHPRKGFGFSCSGRDRGDLSAGAGRYRKESGAAKSGTESEKGPENFWRENAETGICCSNEVHDIRIEAI